MSACHQRNNAKRYREPYEDEIERRSPCRICFPSGEIHVDRADLLVCPSSKSDGVLHRTESTDGEEWKPKSKPSHKLNHALRSDDVTSVADLADKLGGDA